MTSVFSEKNYTVGGIAALVIILDYVSKFLVRSIMEPGTSISLIQNVLHVTHHMNRGAAFGILQNQNIFLIIVTLIVLAGIAFFYEDIPKSRIICVFVGLIIGGAIGNLFDRALLGYVTDFIDLLIWPIFNVADSALTIGVIGISAYLIWDEWGNRNKGKHCQNSSRSSSLRK